MKNYKQKYEEQLDMNGCLSDKIEKLENKVDYLKEEIEYQDLWRKEYLERIQKAIDYIEKRKTLNWYADGVFVEELLDILKGEE